jgi:hypothetical protein
MNILKSFWILLLFSMITCVDQQSERIVTVDYLLDNASKYASKVVDVRGEVVMEYHGPTICDQKGTPCLFIILPTDANGLSEVKLQKNDMFDKYKRLSLEIGLVQKQLGKAKLLATLRGRFDRYVVLPNGDETIIQKSNENDLVRCRFVLQKVLTLDIHNLEPIAKP